MRVKALLLSSIILLASCGGGNDPPKPTPTCEAPKVVLNGACVDPTPVDPDPVPPTCEAPKQLVDGQCVEPTPTPVCEPPKQVVNGECVDPTPPPPVCEAPKQMVNGECVDPTPPPPVCEPPKQMVNGECVEPAPPQVLPVGHSDASKFELTFQDEFNGTTLDTTKWNTHMWYEDPNPRQNYRVTNGMLKMWLAPPFIKTNRTIDTDGKFQQRYGYFEMRGKLPRGAGVWPAFWLYAHSGNDRPEIDIMEAYGGTTDDGWATDDRRPNTFGLTIHKANSDYTEHEVLYTKLLTHYKPPVDLTANYHVYAARWDSTGVQFYFDGQPLGPKYSDTTGYLSKPMYILVDLWVASFAGTPTTADAVESNSFEIDYVRAWRLK